MDIEWFKGFMQVKPGATITSLRRVEKLEKKKEICPFKAFAWSWENLGQCMKSPARPFQSLTKCGKKKKKKKGIKQSSLKDMNFSRESHSTLQETGQFFIGSDRLSLCASLVQGWNGKGSFSVCLGLSKL